MSHQFNSTDDVREQLAAQQYIADPQLATALFLADRLGKPLFLEGEPGVGKTEVARALAAAFSVPLIRLQCYEGLDANQALYEWNYGRQLLSLRADHEHQHEHHSVDDLFTPQYLIRRPLLQAIDPAVTGGRAVLLIDELDRADEEFEAFLLEILADFQVTIPELGTIRADQPPTVILTSNRTREVHDALKRRCIYHWIDFPTFEKEVAIVLERVPDAPQRLAREVVSLVQELRSEELFKKPGVAETLDWLQALLALDQETLSDDILRETLGVLLKYQDDLERIDSTAARRLLERSQQRVG